MNTIDYPENLGKIFLRNIEIIYLTEGLSEAFEGLLSGFSDSSLAADGIKLSGCNVTVAGSSYTVSSGFIYLKGEVFKVLTNAGSPLVLGGGEVAYFDIVETDFDNARPASIEGGSTHQTRKQRRVQLTKSDSPPTDRMPHNAPTLQNKIRNSTFAPGVPTWFDPRLLGASLSDYFSLVTGEGIVGKEYEGWIVLGVYAGTEEYRGRCLVSYDSTDEDFNGMGETSGAKEHTLTLAETPSHTHEYHDYYIAAGGGGSIQGGGGSATVQDHTLNTDSKGGGGAHNNVQPSIVAALICRKSPNGYYMP